MGEMHFCLLVRGYFQVRECERMILLRSFYRPSLRVIQKSSSLWTMARMICYETDKQKATGKWRLVPGQRAYANWLAWKGDSFWQKKKNGRSGEDRALRFWLLSSAGLVFAMVCLGGLTRLTESGLSMIDWSLLHFRPPQSDAQWLAYFGRYQNSPEYILLHTDMKLEEFKRIYYMEYAHRMMGRLIGAYFLFPALYFSAFRRWRHRPPLSADVKVSLVLIGSLTLAQGFLGWYMVQSGLDPQLVEEGKVPRVSAYRLAAHLSLAFVIYLLTLRLGLASRFHHHEGAARQAATSASHLKPFKRACLASGSLVFLTAASGAFVAGLDAGLLYNTFPKMGHQWLPSDAYLGSPSHLRDAFENPSTVQFHHRLLALSSASAVLGLWLYARRLGPALPRAAQRATHVLLAATLTQASLGIATLLYLVPIPLAAAHQAGSLVLLSVFTCLVSLLP